MDRKLPFDTFTGDNPPNDIRFFGPVQTWLRSFDPPRIRLGTSKCFSGFRLPCSTRSNRCSTNLSVFHPRTATSHQPVTKQNLLRSRLRTSKIQFAPEKESPWLVLSLPRIRDKSNQCAHRDHFFWMLKISNPSYLPHSSGILEELRAPQGFVGSISDLVMATKLYGCNNSLDTFNHRLWHHQHLPSNGRSSIC